MPTTTHDVTLADGSALTVHVADPGTHHAPTVLLPVGPVPAGGERAAELERWGMDPALGQNLVRGLDDAFRVVAFDYTAHLEAHPRPASLTPDTVAADLLAVADAVGAVRFCYYGYSWLALAGLQLALRTDRLDGLAMGGFPPLGGPYAEMLAVTRATHALASASALPAGEDRASGTDTEPERQPDEEAASATDWDAVDVTLTTDQTRQYVTLYEALQGFDDRAALGLSAPRLAFAGSADEIEYSERWGGVHVSIGGRLVAHRDELERSGWQVAVLDGLDHTQAMQPSAVLPVLRPWLERATGRS